jgi:hypothetical protein
MALARPIDAVGPVQAGVEPLRRIRRRLLRRQHEAELVEERLRVVLGGEITALPAPIGPGAGEPVENLPGVGLGDESLVLRQCRERRVVGLRTPQEGGDGVLLHAVQPRRNAGLAKVFLRQDVGRHLAPRGGDPDGVEAEDD